jgi:hypothetical protein
MDVWIRSQSTAVASWRATDLATHPSNLATHPSLNKFSHHRDSTDSSTKFYLVTLFYDHAEECSKISNFFRFLDFTTLYRISLLISRTIVHSWYEEFILMTLLMQYLLFLHINSAQSAYNWN